MNISNQTGDAISKNSQFGLTQIYLIFSEFLSKSENPSEKIIKKILFMLHYFWLDILSVVRYIKEIHH